MTPSTSQESVYAGSGNRIVALLLDLVLLVYLAGAVTATGLPHPLALPSLALLYFAGMPLSPLQGTLGKWICRIKLCDRAGRRLTWRAALVRAGAMFCWFALPFLLHHLSMRVDLGNIAPTTMWWLIAVLPWAPVAFMPRAESLFDLLAGSLVVRYRAGAQSIASAEAMRKPGVANVAGSILICLLAGFAFVNVKGVYRDKDRLMRIAYAIGQTMPLQQKIDAFEARERRWPTAAELGVAEWTPYPDGGGYRLEDGGIRISFSVMPELKGHSIVMRPVRSSRAGRVEWQCVPSSGLRQRFLPAYCRI